MADQSASVVAAGLAIISLLTSRRPAPKLDIDTDGLKTIAQEVRDVWKDQERKRSLSDTSFIPLHVQVIAGLDQNIDASEYLQSDPISPVWSLQDMRRSCAAAVYRFKVRRTIIYGDPGSGKSTLAIALTLGLIERFFDRQDRLVPVMLSLNSWDASRERFGEWIDRRLELTYPSLRSFKRAEGGIGQALVATERIVFILDGLDEIGDGDDFIGAVKQVDAYFPESQHLCVLARSVIKDRVRLRAFATLELNSSPPGRVSDYLASLAGSEGAEPGLAIIAHEFRRQSGNSTSGLVSVLQIPLYLRSAYHSVVEATLSADRIIEVGRGPGGSSQLKKLLLSAEVSRAFEAAPILRRERARGWVGFMAQDMEKRGYQSYAWWRVGDVLPRSILVLLASVLVSPAYLLATVMPVGLTRGLAIGASVGALVGILRGYPVRVHQAIPSLVLVWTSTLVIGAITQSVSQGVVDATQLAIAITSSLILKELLIRVRPLLAVALVAVMSAATVGFVEVASALLLFDDQRRGPRDIFVGVFFGIIVAIVAARLLIDPPKDKMQASRIRLAFTRRITSVWWPILSAILAASLIGIGGAIGGGLRYGQEYALSLFYFFGLTIGVPVGVVGGFVKWLSLPLLTGQSAAGSSPRAIEGAPLQSDRGVALCALAGLAAAASGAITLFVSALDGQFEIIREVNGPGFLLQPVQGILYGLTMGVIVACFFTAWPTYFIAHKWLVIVGRRYPWQHQTLLEALVNVNLMRNEGPLLYFRHRELQTYLSEEVGARAKSRGQI